MKPLALPYILLTLVTALLYGQTINYDFVYDDIPHVEQNSLVRRSTGLLALPWSEIFLSPTFPGDLYRPVTTLTYSVVHLVAGNSPGEQHGVNLLLHISVVCLLYGVLLKVLNSLYPAFAGALIFALHPLQIESVASVVGRGELCAAFFGLSALLIFNHAIKIGSSTALYALGATALCLALLSKESALTYLWCIPLVLAFGFYRPATLRVYIGLFISGLIGITARVAVLGGKFAPTSDGTVYPENPLFHLNFSERLLPAIVVLGDYIRAFFLPTSLSADYSVMPDLLLSRMYSVDGLLSVVCVAVLATLGWRVKPLRLGSLWFFLSFVITSNIISPIGTIRADRLTYTPNIGLVILGASLIALCTLRWVRIIAAAAPVSLCAIISLSRVSVWENKGELFSRTANDSPQSPKAMYNYGLYLFRDRKDLPRAEEYLRRAIELNPKHLDSAKLLADIALQRGEYGRLEFWYRRILEIRPDEERVKHQLKALEVFKNAQKDG